MWFWLSFYHFILYSIYFYQGSPGSYGPAGFPGIKVRRQSTSSSLNSSISEVWFSIGLCRYRISSYLIAWQPYVLVLPVATKVVWTVSLNFCHSLKFVWNWLMGYEVVSRRESSGTCRYHNRKGTQHGTLAMVTFFLWFCIIHIFLILLAQKNPVVVMNLEHGLKNNRCTYIDLCLTLFPLPCSFLNLMKVMMMLFTKHINVQVFVCRVMFQMTSICRITFYSVFSFF